MFHSSMLHENNWATINSVVKKKVAKIYPLYDMIADRDCRNLINVVTVYRVCKDVGFRVKFMFG